MGKPFLLESPWEILQWNQFRSSETPQQPLRFVSIVTFPFGDSNCTLYHREHCVKATQDTSPQFFSLFFSRTYTVILKMLPWLVLMGLSSDWVLDHVHSFLSLRKACNSMSPITYSFRGQGSLLWSSMGQLSHCPILLEITSSPYITESPESAAL